MPTVQQEEEFTTCLIVQFPAQGKEPILLMTEFVAKCNPEYHALKLFNSRTDRCYLIVYRQHPEILTEADRQVLLHTMQNLGFPVGGDVGPLVVDPDVDFFTCWFNTFAA